jgi:D-cysteine desulfhydrase
MTDYLGNAFPGIAAKLPKTAFASLPTPLSQHVLDTQAGRSDISIKHDENTSAVYGGNKVRKLEYILHRAIQRGAKRVATFGAIGSNHALATAIFARKLGLQCTCFLAHQRPTANVVPVLNQHLQLGTQLVRYGGGIDQLKLFRRYIQKRDTWVIPLGGSCWFGAVGFVNAGLELAAQIDGGEIPCPERIYIANGTMGSAAGLAIGLALAGIPAQLHAVRVADNSFTHWQVLRKLIDKTALMLQRLDDSFPGDIVRRVNIVWRGEFYAGGYAHADNATKDAVRIAADEFDLELETTYTGKAMAALIHDVRGTTRSSLFWNTYSSQALPIRALGGANIDTNRLPREFLRYYTATHSKQRS